MAVANLQRIPVEHGALFPEPVILMGIEATNNFDMQRAGVPDAQDRDKETGERLWAVSVMDMHQPAGRRELKIRLASEVQPVPPSPIGSPVEFVGIEVVPYIDSNRAKPRVGLSLRARGFRDQSSSRRPARGEAAATA